MKDKFGGEWKGKVFFDEGEHDRQFGAFRMIHVPLDFEERSVEHRNDEHEE